MTGTPSLQRSRDRSGVDGQRGVALVMVLLMVAILFVLAMGLLFQASTERIVAANEQDHLKAMAFAEAGLTWAQRRILDASASNSFSDLLLGPDNGDSADDFLLGLRDLSLTDPDQFTVANEGTASALVQRDFTGDGTQSWEAIRLQDGSGTRAVVYVRIDDNFDDDPADPGNDDPLTDTDGRIRATAVADYPVFVNATGAPLAAGGARREPARRIVAATYGGGGSTTPAILSNGNLKVEGHLDACGACGALHTNGDLEIKDSSAVCGDATASGTWTEGGSPSIGGASGGGYPAIEVPVINPYDTDYVPSIDVFDTSSLNLPSELKCGPPSTSDPGNAKYFAFVADDAKGKIFKAYWDFTNARWTWKLIDDLADATNEQIDECGRAPGDPSYGTGVDDTKDDEFYGWKLEKSEATEFCTACGVAGEDASLCSLDDNDFGLNGYYDAVSGSPVTSVTGSSIPAFPGSFAPDGLLDLQPAVRHKDSLWQTKTDKLYAPLNNAVIFFYGNVKVAHDVGKPGKDYCSASACGAMPFSMWMASLIAYGDIKLDHKSYHGRANPGAEFPVLFVAGRDLELTNDLSELTATCASGCSTSAPSDIAALAGIMATHEQAEITGGNASLFGTILIEDAIGCSDEVNIDGGRRSKLKDFSLFYDCTHPSTSDAGSGSLLSWQEVD